MPERAGNDHIAVGNPDLTDDKDNAWSDEELMAGVAEREARAFEILVRRHQRRVLNLIYRSLGDRTQAEDLAQEVFLRVWRAAKAYEPKAKFTTWLYRIAVNISMDALKAAHRKQLPEHWFSGNDETKGNGGVLNGCDSAPSPEELLIDVEETGRIFAALQDLPANQRLAVVLKKFDGLSYDEISRILECSHSAVESLLVRAKKHLLQRLLLPN